jgi:hypothetical protein
MLRLASLLVLLGACMGVPLSKVIFPCSLFLGLMWNFLYYEDSFRENFVVQLRCGAVQNAACKQLNTVPSGAQGRLSRREAVQWRTCCSEADKEP